MTVIFSGPSYTGPTPSTDIALVDSGGSAALIDSSVLELYGGGGAAPALALALGRGVDPDAVPGACWESNDGPACFAFAFASGLVFSPNGDESSVTFPIRSAVSSAESARLSFTPSFAPTFAFSFSFASSFAVSSTTALTLLELLTLPGPLAPPASSILLIPNAQRSRCYVDPNDEEGDGSGCDPVMNTDSDRGVWFPPRPRDGGTPTSRVGGGVCEADCAWSSAWITASTSSMQISTFSGFRSACPRQR